MTTQLNPQMVKIYLHGEIETIKLKINVGNILPVVGQGQIQVLQKFYDLFNLESISLEDVEYVNVDKHD
jgi:hypothetical protein